MSNKRLELDIATLSEITNFANPIPMSRGITANFMAKRFPDWEWNELVPVLWRIGILRHRPVHQEGLTRLRQGLFIAAEIRTVVLEKVGSSSEVKVEIFIGGQQ